MTEEQISNYNKQRIFLCARCKYRSRTKESGIVCKINGKKPDFFIFCPYFKYSKSKPAYLEISEDSIFVHLLLFFIIISQFIVFVTHTIYYPIIIFVITGIFLYFYIKHPKLFSNPSLGLYLNLVSQAAINKNLNDEEKMTIKQQIIRLYGKQNVKEFADVYKKNRKKKRELKYYRPYLIFISSKNLQVIFQKICEVYVINNVDKFKSDRFIYKIGVFLKIDDNFIENTQKIYLELEKLRQKKYEEEQQNKRRYQEQQRKYEQQQKESYRYEKRKSLDSFYKSYYEILGISSSATDDEIKKRFKQLALKYHPDRFAGKSEKRISEATEKFKVINHAYTYIRKSRGF